MVQARRTGLGHNPGGRPGMAPLGGARPNPFPFTVCRLRAIEGDSLHVEGLDLVDGTPVLDVKPYIPHYDAVPGATMPRWAEGP